MSGEGELRVVFVTAARRWTGGERCMTTVARGLARRGHAVVLTYDPRGPVGERAGDGVPTRPVLIRGDGDLPNILRLRRLISEHRVDVVCTNTFRELKVGGSAARLSGRARLVARMGLDDALLNGRRARLIYRLVHAVIRDSEAGLRRMREENPWFGRPTFLARNGVDVAALERVRPAERNELGASPGQVVVAAVGRVGAVKGSAALAAAATSLSARHRLHLCFIGAADAEAVAEVRRELGDPGVSVRFLGERTAADTLRLVAAADVFARPTTTDGISYAVLEAMALGVPVLASRVGGLPEAVVHGETGLLVPPADASALAASLAELAADPERRTRLGAAGRERVRAEFTEERMLDAYEAAFRATIGSAA